MVCDGPVGDAGDAPQGEAAVGDDEGVGGVVGLAPLPAAAAVAGVGVVLGRQGDGLAAARADEQLHRIGPGACGEHVLLLDVGQQGEGPRAGLVGPGAVGVADAPVEGVIDDGVLGVDEGGRAAGGEDGLLAVPAAVVGEGVPVVVVHLEGEADLLEVVGAGHAVSGLAHLLHGGQEHGQQHGDDGDHDEQLDQGHRRHSDRRSTGHIEPLKRGEQRDGSKHRLPSHKRSQSEKIPELFIPRNSGIFPRTGDGNEASCRQATSPRQRRILQGTVPKEIRRTYSPSRRH